MSNYTGLSSLSTTGELTVVVFVMTFLLFIITLIFYFRARRYMGVTNASQQPRPRRRLMFVPSQTASSLHRPLDPSVLKSLSVTVFRCDDYEEEGGLDCAVCLSEFTEGEEVRLLPKCNHRFHVECIDMWFRSNSTCPLCRLPVGPTPAINVKPLSRVIPLRNDSPASITTSFDKGSTSSTTISSSSGMLAIDISIESIHPQREGL